MLPGQKYELDDLLGIVSRRRWLIIVPFLLIAAAAVLTTRLLPDRYRSETLIMVVPQRVPESYVRSTVTTRIEDRLNSISQQILSRTRLERVIVDFDLYSEERRLGIMEDVVERMRKDIVVQLVKGDAFRISYTSDNPQIAMRVTERLATLFIDENLKDREVLAVGTNEFLEGQLTEARQKLIDQENKLEIYRKQFAGQLPSQLQANLQALQNTQLQIQALIDSMNRDRDRRLMLERLVESETPQTTEPPPGESDDGTSTPVRLDSARKALAALESRLKREHPDIRRMKRIIADLEKQADAQTQSGSSAASRSTSSPEETARLGRFREMRAEIDSLSRQISYKESEERRLRALAGSYQAKIDAVPSRESQLAELTRDYDTTQKVYQDLLAKKQDSQVAANLERRQIGEQFKVLDPARLPEKPFSPNRWLIAGGGMFGGLMVGFGLVALVEYRDRTFRSEPDISMVLGLSVLATVPEMLTAAEVAQRQRRKVAARVSAAACVCVAALVATWKFRDVLESWVR